MNEKQEDKAKVGTMENLVDVAQVQPQKQSRKSIGIDRQTHTHHLPCLSESAHHSPNSPGTMILGCGTRSGSKKQNLKDELSELVLRFLDLFSSWI